MTQTIRRKGNGLRMRYHDEKPNQQTERRSQDYFNNFSCCLKYSLVVSSNQFKFMALQPTNQFKLV